MGFDYSEKKDTVTTNLGPHSLQLKIKVAKT